MPLAKRGEGTTLSPSVAADATAAEAPANGGLATPSTESTAAASKKLGGTRKAGDKADAPLTKEGYWDRKEARDIETGIRIRRSGAWQAALQSMGVLQLNRDNTLEGFLALVEKAADAGIKYINRD